MSTAADTPCTTNENLSCPLFTPLATGLEAEGHTISKGDRVHGKETMYVSDTGCLQEDAIADFGLVSVHPVTSQLLTCGWLAPKVLYKSIALSTTRSAHCRLVLPTNSVLVALIWACSFLQGGYTSATLFLTCKWPRAPSLMLRGTSGAALYVQAAVAMLLFMKATRLVAFIHDSKDELSIFGFDQVYAVDALEVWHELFFPAVISADNCLSGWPVHSSAACC